jgi:multiple antibiotic resistance protein
VFATLTAGGGAAYARDMAVRSAIVAGAILFFFAFAGPWLLDHLGISLDSFRAAGGALLFLIALDMVFEKRQERRKHRADEVLSDHPERLIDDISVFPLAIPMIAGPGSIATAMLFMKDAGSEPVSVAIVSVAIAANLVLTALIFMAATPLLRLLGENVAGAVTRIFGVILAALAVQFVVDGLRGAFGLA